MLGDKDKQEIKDIVFTYIDPAEYRVSIFGSRATDLARKYSDIDIGIEGSIPVSGRVMSDIKSAFEDSNISYRVDVVDFNQVTPKFRQIALKKVISLN
jgi:uncharacterized protein